MISVRTLEEFQQQVREEPALLYYISHESCNVCKVLKPKIIALLSEHFPKMNMYYIDAKQTPEISAQLSVFAVPTIIVYFDRKEFFRFSRNISLAELEEKLQKTYNLMFDS